MPAPYALGLENKVCVGPLVDMHARNAAYLKVKRVEMRRVNGMKCMVTVYLENGLRGGRI
jgi:hypothetical protein